MDDIVTKIQEEELKSKIINDLISKNLVKTCNICGKYNENYYRNTRHCLECNKIYRHNYYIKRKLRK